MQLIQMAGETEKIAVMPMLVRMFEYTKKKPVWANKGEWDTHNNKIL